MSFMATQAYVEYEKAYARERGYMTSAVDGRRVPMITWGDAMSFYLAFMKATDTVNTCIAEAPPENLPTTVDIFTALIGANAATKKLAILDRCTKHLQSSEFQAAKAAFEAESPLMRAFPLAGPTAPLYVLAHIRDPYPYAEAFWKAARVYAIRRDAAGMVKGNVDLAIEALDEAIRDLPDTVKTALAKGLPGLPTLSRIATIIKWGVIGGLAIAAWWYLSPRLQRK